MSPHDADRLRQLAHELSRSLRHPRIEKENQAMPDKHDHDINKAQHNLQDAKQEQREGEMMGEPPRQQRQDAQKVHEERHDVHQERREKRRDD
jgi:hypothetical protein